VTEISRLLRAWPTLLKEIVPKGRSSFRENMSMAPFTLFLRLSCSGGWPRLRSEKRLWVAYIAGLFLAPPPHPAALCGMNGGVFLLSLF
jgi:hypothetical protein